jgi:hypothetical protein
VLTPLLEEDDGNQEYESIGTHFQIDNHSWDEDHWKFYGDPIYDTNDEFSKAKRADFLSLGSQSYWWYVQKIVK